MSVGYKTKKLVWKRDKGCCFYCGIKLSWESKTADHVIPRSKGGSSRAWNIVLSCLPCNQNKGDSDPTAEQMDTILRWKMAHEMKNTVAKAMAIARQNGHGEKVKELETIQEEVFSIIFAKAPMTVPTPTLRISDIGFTSLVQ